MRSWTLGYIMFLNMYRIPSVNLGHTNQILCIKNISIETLGNMKSYLLSDGFKSQRNPGHFKDNKVPKLT